MADEPRYYGMTAAECYDDPLGYLDAKYKAEVAADPVKAAAEWRSVVDMALPLWAHSKWLSPTVRVLDPDADSGTRH